MEKGEPQVTGLFAFITIAGVMFLIFGIGGLIADSAWFARLIERVERRIG